MGRDARAVHGAQLHTINAKMDALAHGSLLTRPQQPLKLDAALGTHPHVELTRGAQAREPAARYPAMVSGWGRDADCEKWQLWCSKYKASCSSGLQLLWSQQSHFCQ